MPKNSNAEREENSQSSKNIQIPPIRKQTAAAVAGAAAGSIAGPIGAVVGGVVGAAVGKAAEKGQPIVPQARRTVRSVIKRTKAVSKMAPTRSRSTRSSANKGKDGGRSAGKTKKTASRRGTMTASRSASKTRGAPKSSRSAANRSGSRRKRH
jgi:hypothetical protein